MNVKIIGLGTANPPLRVSQQEVYEAYARLIPLSANARTLLHQLLVENRSIAYRYMGLESLSEAAHHVTQDELIARYLKYAVPVAVKAAQEALNQAGLCPTDLDALVINTCTGYLCPGLTSYVAEALQLRKDVRPFDLQGMGCGGAVPCLETGFNYLHVYPNSNVLTISVEICTATIFFDEDPGILVSNAIFGDGAAATVLTNRPVPGGLRLIRFAAGLFPEYRAHLQYRTEDSRLRNVLSRRVPILGAKCGQQVVDRLLGESGLSYGDIAHWAVHTGGEKVLDAFARTLGLAPEHLLPARTVLHEYGNMSSASVLFVLQELLRLRQPRLGEYIALVAFGAGFTAFAALLEQAGM